LRPIAAKPEDERLCNPSTDAPQDGSNSSIKVRL
jgi:hypothetical protein